jgi:hypothetical protein
MTGNTEKSDSLGINRGVPFGDELGITRGIAGGGAGINRGAGGNGGLGRGLGANSYQPGTPRFTLARPARSDDGPPIHIVYVIDISGSMEEGGKILRVRDAMEKALSELRNEDYFNIVFFSDRATLFAPTMRPATASNVSAGVLSVGVNEPNGATNLSAALDLALELAEQRLPDARDEVQLGGPHQLEVLEQLRRQRRKSVLVAEDKAERVHVGAARFLDPVPDKVETGFGDLGRRFAGQAFAQQQRHGGRERNLIPRLCARNRVRAHPHLERTPQIVAHPRHAARAKRLDAHGFDGVEHRARDNGLRRGAVMGGRVMMPQAQGKAIGKAISKAIG